MNAAIKHQDQQDEPEPATRRERRAAARRAQILAAATRVFAEKGFQRATTKDIADAADLAEGTLYNYFASKDDLLLALLQQLAQFQLRTEQLAEGVDQEPRDFFVRHFGQRLEHLLPSYPLLLAVLPEILANPELRRRYARDFLQPGIQMIESHLQARVERGQIQTADAALAARLIVSALLGLQLLLILDEPLTMAAWQNPAQLVEFITDLYLNGLKPRE